MFAYKMTDWRGNVNSREAARDLTLPRPVCPLYFSRVTCRRGAGRPPTDDGGQCARSSTTDDCRLTRSALRTDRQAAVDSVVVSPTALPSDVARAAST